MRCQAIITVATGRRGTKQFPLQRVESYTTTQSLDNDSDSFSIDIGDPDNLLSLCCDRDNEVRLQLFLTDGLGKMHPIFRGIADDVLKSTDFTLSIQGRDEPSSLADSDALPRFWGKGTTPSGIIIANAHALGISNVKCPKMAPFGRRQWTDGSEKEWALWYRFARARDMYMWTDNTGALLIDKLGYALKPSYKFGVPSRGQSTNGWIPVEDAPLTSSKNTRIHRAIMYGTKGGTKHKKKALTTAMVAQGIDTSIAGWRKRPTTILTSAIAKTQAELKKAADLEVFESIVGAQELVLTVQDYGELIQQNEMALVNLPDYGIVNEPWFVVGVERQGGAAGFTQIVRLREKGFALSKRKPDAPALTNTKDSATDKPIGGIAAALTGIRWADSFVRGTQEYGVHAGWDFAVFLGALMAMCYVETNFSNERERNANAVGNGQEWQPYDQWLNSGARLTSTKNAAELLVEYQQTFANSAHNSLNPFRNRGTSAEAGVGPMQLTSAGYKTWADQIGWNNVPNTDEYQGGRWNPDANIRAAARVLVEKLKASPPANPTDSATIWIGVARYNGSTAYANKVKQWYDSEFYAKAQSAIAEAQSLPANSAVRSFNIPGHGVVTLVSSAPDEAAKAITWAMQRYGDPYEWGGSGPYYDCSSFVTKALASSAAYLRKMLDEPVSENNHHGETTYTLFAKGTAVTKDSLLPGDLVFFRGDPPEHVGMYIGDGLFIHDPQPGETVTVAAIGDKYFRERWTGARRYITWVSRGG